MKKLIYLFVIFLLFGCGKGAYPGKVDIYLLKSHSQFTTGTAYPYITAITNAVLSDTILVKSEQIVSYDSTTHVFTTKKGALNSLKNFGSNRAFAVTVNKEIVYCGQFRPGYLSSIVTGIASINPAFSEGTEKLGIQYVSVAGSAVIAQLDKRNDIRITGLLKQQGRLK
ncbi:hypothetical protein [Hufsiella ginkgonis]|uniref:Lipoprotein n=1 Tax=Hufsiella ginkgonis TaxID=2695274 RepID=A0A7K1Y1N4_9SPHI|nr:hypothetical protein [Hufsiella ginkgonis]MXV17155.1 hypothetical protein [Hufsiella ginkgonis]